jgi:hypothetical protein
MLFGETVAAYCENHTEHTDTFRGQNTEFWYVKAGGIYINHWDSKGSMTVRSVAIADTEARNKCLNYLENSMKETTA